MGFDKIFDLIAGVYFYFYNIHQLLAKPLLPDGAPERGRQNIVNYRTLLNVVGLHFVFYVLRRYSFVACLQYGRVEKSRSSERARLQVFLSVVFLNKVKRSLLRGTYERPGEPPCLGDNVYVVISPA